MSSGVSKRFRMISLTIYRHSWQKTAFKKPQEKTNDNDTSKVLGHSEEDRDDAPAEDDKWKPELGSQLSQHHVARNFARNIGQVKHSKRNVDLVAVQGKVCCQARDFGIADVGLGHGQKEHNVG